MRTRRNTTETEERVRQLLGPADPARHDSGPPPEAVLTRILTSNAPDLGPTPDHRPRRRWVIGVAVVFALGAGGLAAQATGVIPDDVDWGLNRAGHGPGSEGLEPDTDRAKLLIAGRVPDGQRWEYWSAPNPSGGSCAYVRVLDRDGRRTQQGWSECGRVGEHAVRRTMWASVDTVGLSDWTTVYGRAPRGAVSVRVTWEDGTTEGPITVGADRYFAAFLSYEARSAEGWAQEYRTEALDADGRVLQVVYSNR